MVEAARATVLNQKQGGSIPSRCSQHDDLSVAHEAADEIILLTERLRAEKERSAIWEQASREAR